MKTLGELLPKKQADMLTNRVKKMTKADIEEQAALHKRSDLSYYDITSLKHLAVHRINSGDTIYTYSSQSFIKKGNGKQDPSTCSCFSIG
jgi:hypothetical protein